MAHKKGLGSSRNGRDSNAQRLGVKMFAGELVTGGEIIVRQRGSRFKAGEGVGMGKDDTLYARAIGTLDFTEGRRGRVVRVLPLDEARRASLAGGSATAVAEKPAAAPKGAGGSGSSQDTPRGAADAAASAPVADDLAQQGGADPEDAAGDPPAAGSDSAVGDRTPRGAADAAASVPDADELGADSSEA